jgi:hypothetical protein
MTRLLSWLARGMVQHHQDTFSRLQLDWLSSKGSKQLYTLIFVAQILLLSIIPFICMVKLLGATSPLILHAGNIGALSFGLPIAPIGIGLLVLALVSLLVSVLLRATSFGNERKIGASNRAITSFVLCGLLSLLSLPSSMYRTFALGFIISCFFVLALIGLVLAGWLRAMSFGSERRIATSNVALTSSLLCIVLGVFFTLIAFGPGIIVNVFIFASINIIALTAFGVAEYFLYKWLQRYRKTSQFIVKLALFWERSLPWNYEDFFNYAVEKGILYKVGKGYSFAHTLLLNYFAELIDPLKD